MIQMAGNDTLRAAYEQSVLDAAELVPGAKPLYERGRLEELLQLLTTVRNNAFTEAQQLRNQSKATEDKQERKELEEEAADVEKTGHIIGRAVLALDLCST